MEKMNRWLVKHYIVVNRVLTLLWAVLAIVGMMIWNWPMLVALLVYFAGTIVSSVLLLGCGQRLMRGKVEAVNQQCDPEPMLEETKAQLAYSIPPMQKLVVEINHALALQHTGQYEEAYERLNDIFIDHPRISPNIKLVYYNNRADLCFLMGKYEETETLYEKSVQLFQNLKPGKAKENLRSTVEGNRALYHYCREEYDEALQVLEQVTPKHLFQRVSNAMTHAQVHLAMGEQEKAKEKLQFVIENGNKLYFVTEARALLAEINMEE